MRPVQRKPVGSGYSSPPPTDFVIPSMVSEPVHQPSNPYHAISLPSSDHRPTTTAAPQREWKNSSPYQESNNPFDHNWHNGTSQSLQSRLDPPEPQHYQYSASVADSDVASEVSLWQSSSSTVYQPAPDSHLPSVPAIPMAPVSPLHYSRPEAELHQEYEPVYEEPAFQPEFQESPYEEPQTPDTPDTRASPYQPSLANPPDEAALGIGTGSDYIRRRRRGAGITSSSTTPTTLPIGIKAVPVSHQMSAPPAFVRKAMDIRYAHLPQRMLASEIDDEDQIPDSPVGRVSHDSTPVSIKGYHRHSHSLTTVNTRSSLRRTSSSESVVEDTGKIKLFVANPDD